jgi:hypothetical protein
MGLPIDIVPFKNAAIEMMAMVETIESDQGIEQGFFPQMESAITLKVPQHKAWLTGLKAEKTLQEARILYLGDHYFKIDMPKITCTGSDVITRFNIPYAFQFNRIEFKHTDSSNADSSNILTYGLDKKTWNNLVMTYLAVITSSASDIIQEFEDYFFEKGEFVLTTNSINTELLYLTIYIKILEV